MGALGTWWVTVLGAAASPCLSLVSQPEASQRHASQPYAETAERLATTDGLGHDFGEFIEFVCHMFPFLGLCVSV